MKKIALIVEGHGDIKAAPALVAKTGNLFSTPIYTSEPPIRAGEAKKLRRVGELERYLRLASTRPEVDEIFVILDLDDGCPVEYANDFSQRAHAIAGQINKPVHICFCVREFESWMIADLQTLARELPEYGIDSSIFGGNSENTRDAKGVLKRACKTKQYKESRDQIIFIKKIDPKIVAQKSRSYRKLIKAITGMNYENILTACTSERENVATRA